MFDANCSLFIYPKRGKTVVVFVKLFMRISPTLLLSLTTTEDQVEITVLTSVISRTQFFFQTAMPWLGSYDTQTNTGSSGRRQAMYQFLLSWSSFTSSTNLIRLHAHGGEASDSQRSYVTPSGPGADLLGSLFNCICLLYTTAGASLPPLLAYVFQICCAGVVCGVDWSKGNQFLLAVLVVTGLRGEICPGRVLGCASLVPRPFYYAHAPDPSVMRMRGRGMRIIEGSGNQTRIVLDSWDGSLVLLLLCLLLQFVVLIGRFG